MQSQNPWRGGLQFIKAEAGSVVRKRADFAESGIPLKIIPRLLVPHPVEQQFNDISFFRAQIRLG